MLTATAELHQLGACREGIEAFQATGAPTYATAWSVIQPRADWLLFPLPREHMTSYGITGLNYYSLVTLEVANDCWFSTVDTEKERYRLHRMWVRWWHQEKRPQPQMAALLTHAIRQLSPAHTREARMLHLGRFLRSLLPHYPGTPF